MNASYSNGPGYISNIIHMPAITTHCFPCKHWLIVSALVCVIALPLCAHAEESFLELMPPNTDVIEHKNEGSPRAVTLTVYKFKTQSSRKEIVKFYRHLFYNQGYQEYEDSAAAADNMMNQSPYYLFSRSGKLGVLNIVEDSKEPQEMLEQEAQEASEEPTLTYYVTIHNLPRT